MQPASTIDEPPYLLSLPNGNGNGAGRNGSGGGSGSGSGASELTRSQRMVSACTGALLTSLLVTPFDVIKTRMQAQSPVPKSDAAGASRSPSPNASDAARATTTEHVHRHTSGGGAGGGDAVHRHHHLGTMNAVQSGGLRAGTATAATPTATALHTHAHTLSHGHAHAHPHVHSAACGPLHLLSTPELMSRCTHYQYSNGLMDIWCLKCDLPRPISNIRFDGPIDTAVKIIRHEGALNLWRGLAPTLVMSVPSTIIYFSAYDELKSQFERLLAPAATTATAANTASTPATAAASASGSAAATASNSLVSALPPLLAGTSARAFTTTLVSPLELIRTKLQAERHAHSGHDHTSAKSNAAPARRGMWSIVRSEIAGTTNGGSGKGGVLNLWRGVGPTLWRDVPFSAIYWTSYEQLKSVYLRSLTRGIPAGSRALATAQQQPANLAWAAFLAGATGGMTAAAITHPFDVVKTRRQIEMYNFEITGAAATPNASGGGSGGGASTGSMRRPVSSTGTILQTIWAEEGLRGLYTGLIARMAKVAPACAIMISTYEFAKAYFRTSTPLGAAPPKAD